MNIAQPLQTEAVIALRKNIRTSLKYYFRLTKFPISYFLLPTSYFLFPLGIIFSLNYRYLDTP